MMALSEKEESLLEQLEQATCSQLNESTGTKNLLSMKQYYALRIPATPLVVDPVELSTNVKGFVENVHECYQACENVEGHTKKSIALLQEMEDRHESVSTLTTALYESFETLLKELDTLNVKVQNLEGPLPYFTRISTISKAIGSKVDFSSKIESNGNSIVILYVRPYSFGNLDPTSPSFEQGMYDIDQCITFLQQHPEFKDTQMYLSAYGELLTHGLHTLRDYAVATLETARDQVLVGIAKNPVNFQNDLDEASIYYIQFHLASAACQAITKHMDQRQLVSSIETFLPDVLDAYVSIRIQLLNPVVSAYLANVNQSTDIVNLLRIGCQYMVRLCQAEYALFTRMFGVAPTASVLQVEDQEENAFQRMLFQLSYTLYNTVRPRMIQQHNLEVLCEIIEVLRSEIIEMQIRPRGHAAEDLEPVIERMIGDAQERLILCTQKYIRDEIEDFIPTQEHLNYPERLSAPTVYATWYPTLEHTLLCLSKVYRYVHMHIFEELAQDAVRICTASLKMASADITVQKGTLDGGLFLVKHLLTLRERITPFDIQFSITEKNLDFSSTSDAMGSILNGNILTDAFTMSLENSILSLLTHGIPHVNTKTSDVKKDLEQELKKSCTVFIEYAVQAAAHPLVHFLQKVNATRKAQIAPIRTQPATSPDIKEALLAILKQQNGHIGAQVQIVQQKIHDYLMNSSTESILFKPIQKGLHDLIDQLQSTLSTEYSNEDMQVVRVEIEALEQFLIQFQ